MPEYSFEEGVDIRGSREKIFELVADFPKRTYLGPFWTVVEIEQLTPGPVGVGTVFQHHVKREDMEMENEYTSEIVTFSPGFRLAYKISTRHNLLVTWTVTAIDDEITHLSYQESVVLEERDGDHEQVLEFMKNYAREWLDALKQYLQLEETGLQGAFKWLIDRFLLKMPPQQRRVVIMLLAFKLFIAGSFITIALMFGLYKLIGLLI
jgi:hypothetical protein